MRQFATIATNAFMELVRQPIFLLLTTATAAFEIFLATPYYFAFGDEPKLVKNSVLAVMLLAGLFGAVLTASCLCVQAPSIRAADRHANFRECGNRVMTGISWQRRPRCGGAHAL